MQFKEVLKACVNQNVIINNRDERTLIGVEDDFIILQGGNPQMKLTEFVPLAQVVKVIRADYAATGDSSTSIDLPVTGGDASRSAAH